MYVFSDRDQQELNTCCISLIQLCTEVIKRYSCTVLCGRRGKEKQNKYYELKKSKVKYPDSPHNKVLSEAVDICPLPIPDNWGDISWKLIPKKHREQIQREIKERCKFYHFNGYVKGTADQMGIKIRQGHDWDSDNEFNDQTFDDLVHTETVEE